jgi:chemotaxis regulatin CheY-phosphate phosphatase CheZ
MTYIGSSRLTGSGIQVMLKIVSEEVEAALLKLLMESICELRS